MLSIINFINHLLSFHTPLFIAYLLFFLINVCFDTCLSNSDSTYYSLLFDYDNYDINSNYDYFSSSSPSNNNISFIKKSSKSYFLIYFINSFCFGLPFTLLLLLENHNYDNDDNENIIGKISPHHLEFFISWFGIFLIFLGIWLRWYAMRINKFFTRILRIGEEFIVTEGPYRYIRHPGYLGQLLIWIGFGLSSGNYLIALIISIAIIITYLYRIRREEAILLSTFGVDYLEYSTRVSKLIPYIY
ncbi:hypothetical protein RclHR1_00570025 [Rhizophagus clarus]|uniref:Uncharacterized protein n=1 Tax=Rhizophagus clarus TaxID=94130 RepID=A0A2Z6SGJ2_9GLOM|nr:hypothetical protein RclHR1_00570025 [Rhizophagus clarus]